MKKRFLVLAMAVTMVCALVGGVTFALFTNSASNNPKNFTAGTVIISSQRDLGDPVPGPMFYTTAEQGQGIPGETQTGLNKITGPWQPGDYHAAQLDVYNNGSLRVRLNRIGAEITGDSDFLNNQTAVDEFAQYMNVQVVESGTNATLYDGPLSGLLVSDGIPTIYRPEIAGYSGSGIPSCEHLTFTCTLNIHAGNVLQGKNPIVSFSLWAEQTQNN